MTHKLTRKESCSNRRRLPGCLFSETYCGGYSGEDPPLPIPNREVKLTIADGTAPPGGRVGSCHFLIRSPRHQKMSGTFCVCKSGSCPPPVLTVVRTAPVGHASLRCAAAGWPLRPTPSLRCGRTRPRPLKRPSLRSSPHCRSNHPCEILFHYSFRFVWQTV